MVAKSHCQPSTLGTGECTPPAVPGNSYLGTPSGTPRAVVFLFHGLDSWGLNSSTSPPADVTSALFGNTLFATLSADLVTAGFQVVWPMQVGDCKGTATQGNSLIADLSNDPNATKGVRHAAAIDHHVDHLHSWGLRKWPGLPQVAWGMSWGGRYALQAAINKTKYFAAYGAHHPLTVISALNPAIYNLSAYTSSGLDIASTALNNIAIPGYLGWGTNDNIIDYPNSGDNTTRALYTAAHGAGAPVTSNSQPENHCLSSADVTAIMQWFGSSPGSGQLPF